MPEEVHILNWIVKIFKETILNIPKSYRKLWGKAKIIQENYVLKKRVSVVFVLQYSFLESGGCC